MKEISYHEGCLSILEPYQRHIFNSMHMFYYEHQNTKKRRGWELNPSRLCRMEKALHNATPALRYSLNGFAYQILQDNVTSWLEAKHFVFIITYHSCSGWNTIQRWVENEGGNQFSWKYIVRMSGWLFLQTQSFWWWISGSRIHWSLLPKPKNRLSSRRTPSDG